MPHSEALFEKSCLRCHPTHRYHRMGSSGVKQLFNPPRDIPRGPHACVHMPACPPHFLRSSTWNQRVRETPCSDVARRCDGALTARIHAMAEGLIFEEGLFVLLVLDVLLHDILFYTLCLLGVFFRRPQGWSTSLGAGQHTLRLLALCTRLLTFPEPSCWLNCTEGGPGGSRMCHRGFGSGPCPCTHPLSRFQGEGCQCPCRGAGSSLRTAL